MSPSRRRIIIFRKAGYELCRAQGQCEWSAAFDQSWAVMICVSPESDMEVTRSCSLIATSLIRARLFSTACVSFLLRRRCQVQPDGLAGYLKGCRLACISVAICLCQRELSALAGVDLS